VETIEARYERISSAYGDFGLDLEVDANEMRIGWGIRWRWRKGMNKHVPCYPIGA
jgi:hypothetical protein